MVTGDHMTIEVIGKEKAIYNDKHVSENSKDFRRTFITYKGKALDLAGGLSAGNYEIPFEFALPEGELPQSINHKNNLEDYSVDVAVKYFIKLEIKTESG